MQLNCLLDNSFDHHSNHLSMQNDQQFHPSVMYNTRHPTNSSYRQTTTVYSQDLTNNYGLISNSEQLQNDCFYQVEKQSTSPPSRPNNSSRVHSYNPSQMQNTQAYPQMNNNSQTRQTEQQYNQESKYEFEQLSNQEMYTYNDQELDFTKQHKQYKSRSITYESDSDIFQQFEYHQERYNQTQNRLTDELYQADMILEHNNLNQNSKLNQKNQKLNSSFDLEYQGDNEKIKYQNQINSEDYLDNQMNQMNDNIVERYDNILENSFNNYTNYNNNNNNDDELQFQNNSNTIEQELNFNQQPNFPNPQGQSDQEQNYSYDYNNYEDQQIQNNANNWQCKQEFKTFNMVDQPNNNEYQQNINQTPHNAYQNNVHYSNVKQEIDQTSNINFDAYDNNKQYDTYQDSNGINNYNQSNYQQQENQCMPIINNYQQGYQNHSNMKENTTSEYQTHTPNFNSYLSVKHEDADVCSTVAQTPNNVNESFEDLYDHHLEQSELISHTTQQNQFSFQQEFKLKQFENGEFCFEDSLQLIEPFLNQEGPSIIYQNNNSYGMLEEIPDIPNQQSDIEVEKQNNQIEYANQNDYLSNENNNLVQSNQNQKDTHILKIGQEIVYDKKHSLKKLSRKQLELMKKQRKNYQITNPKTQNQIEKMEQEPPLQQVIKVIKQIHQQHSTRPAKLYMVKDDFFKKTIKVLTCYSFDKYMRDFDKSENQENNTQEQIILEQPINPEQEDNQNQMICENTQMEQEQNDYLFSFQIDFANNSISKKQFQIIQDMNKMRANLIQEKHMSFYSMLILQVFMRMIEQANQKLQEKINLFSGQYIPKRETTEFPGENKAILQMVVRQSKNTLKMLTISAKVIPILMEDYQNPCKNILHYALIFIDAIRRALPPFTCDRCINPRFYLAISYNLNKLVFDHIEYYRFPIATRIFKIFIHNLTVSLIGYFFKLNSKYVLSIMAS